MDFPNKKYNIIYADPPWSYKDKALAGNRGACCKYPVMSIEDIKNLPVKDIADDNCILFMWVTFPKLNECFDIIKSWGFDYKTVAFTWVKKYRNGDNFMGMGRWTRANAEVCLLATKGKPKRLSKSVRQLTIELCGDLPKIELFARIKSDNWDVWGNEV